MTDQFIMESFWQHPEGYNCATVAMIKVAMLRYGPGNVFKCRKTKHAYHIALRDHRKLTIYKDEVKKFNWGNGFHFSNYKVKEKLKAVSILKEQVQLSYAIMIKYLNRFGFEGERYSIKDAKEYLQYGFGEDDPFNTDHLYRFLGIKMASEKVIDLKEKHLKAILTKKAVMLYSYKHVVAVCRGYYDDYGSLRKIRANKIPLIGGCRAEWWYGLK